MKEWQKTLADQYPELAAARKADRARFLMDQLEDLGVPRSSCNVVDYDTIEADGIRFQFRDRWEAWVRDKSPIEVIEDREDLALFIRRYVS